jgi:hypothetical protein
MIYTVGSKKAYFRSLLKNGKVIKSGRKRGYAGGCVFRSREDAQRHVDELEIQGYKDYMVFGLLADWGKDTQPSPQHWWHDLLRDAEVIVLEKSMETGG